MLWVNGLTGDRVYIHMYLLLQSLHKATAVGHLVRYEQHLQIGPQNVFVNHCTATCILTYACLYVDVIGSCQD